MLTTVAAAGSRGQYAKSAAVRQRVLEACVDAFGISGFYGATMKDVAARAGISYTGLLHHFPTKETLLLAVLEYRDSKGTQVYFEASSSIEDTPANAVRAMLEVAVQNETEPGLIALHSTLSSEATTPDHPAYEYFQSRYRALRQFYTDIFQVLASRGELHSTMSPEALAITFIALLDGLQVQWLYEKDSMHMRATIADFLEMVIPKE